ncbi:MAG TPA: ATP-binding protein [Desulfitobacteriaceae bacterium]|nr:ATP-binding protein [Desulfitobacteriaceae bacterium]
MENTVQFCNGREYLNRLLFLARCRLQCTAAEQGFAAENIDSGGTPGREEVRTELEIAYTTAGNNLQKGVFLSLEYLFWLFDCDLFERHAVVLTLLAQIVPETASAFAFIHNDSRLDTATPFALCRTYEEQGEFAEKYFYFTKGSKLLKYFFAGEEAGAASRLSLDKRIVEFILGDKAKVSYYAPIATLWSRDEQPPADQETAARLGAYIRNCGDFARHIVFNLYGEEGGGRKSCLKQIARDLGLNLMFLDPLPLFSEKEPIALTDKILRECLLFQAIPVITGFPAEMRAGERVILSRLFKLITENFAYSFAVTERRLLSADFKDDVLVIAEELGKLTLEASAQLWESESRKYKVDENVSFFELAGEFVLTPGKIKAAFRAASVIAGLYGNGTITFSELKRGCYSTMQWTMGSKAMKVEAVYKWDDLVLPQYQKSMLLTACNQVRYKYNVYQKWGFQDKMSYGKGVSMVFTGPSGTGKTMAAQVVSNELGLDIYKIELATVVSKYVGETEKNLNEIFGRATKSQVILFFDEADVLFSKRTEVKDSNDKYSNMEAAFLLQKMEEYDGVTILATNYIQNFDEAFKRRLKFIIDFPFPNQEQRREIWRKVFPQKLPQGELDYDYLTSKFELSGSNIKNIALHSAFLAAADGSESVEMKHIMAAIRNEFAKGGKIFTKEDAGEYYMLL